MLGLLMYINVTNKTLFLIIVGNVLMVFLFVFVLTPCFPCVSFDNNLYLHHIVLI